MTDIYPETLAKFEVNVGAPKLTDQERAALMLTVLGEDLAAAIVKHLNKGEIEQLAKQIKNIKTIDDEVVNESIENFVHLLKNPNALSKPNLQRADGGTVLSSAIEKAFGKSNPKIAKELKAYIDSEGSPRLTALANVDPKMLANYLTKQSNPQTIALTCSFLPSDTFAKVVKFGPALPWADILWRMANLGEVSKQTIEELDEALTADLKKMRTNAGKEVGGINKVVELLAHLDGESQKRLLNLVEQQDRGLADKIKDKLFIFEDFVKLNDLDIQTVLKHVAQKDLLYALKKCSEEVKAKMLNNMSDRAQARLQEDIEALGKIKLADVEAAQQQIVQVAKQLDAKGEIVLNRSQEVYV